MGPAIRGRLTVLWTSPGYTGHAFAAHPQVPLEVTDQLANAMINMGSTVGGQALLESLGMSGFQAATDADWDNVRALDLH
jgi:phosphonate transport system substrate-binding protein